MPILLFGSHAYAQLTITSSLKPTWTIDVQQSPAYAARMERVGKILSPRLPSPQLVFINAKTIAVSFSDGSWQDYPVHAPRGLFHFRTFFIDVDKHAPTGPALSWPTPDDDAVLLPLAGRGFVILAGKQLIRYSSDIELVKQSPVPVDPHSEPGEEFEPYNDAVVYQMEHWNAQEDPDQRIITLIHSNRHNLAYFWIDPDSLNVIGSAYTVGPPSPRSLRFASTDKLHQPTIISASRAVIYNAFGQSMIVHDDGSRQPSCPSFGSFPHTTFANEDEFFIKYSTNGNVRYALTDSGCNTLLDLPGISNGEVDARDLSRKRIAITERHFGHTALSMRAMKAELRIRVWNLQPPSEVLQLTLSKEETGSIVTGMDDFAAALSPDGKSLAVLVDASLALYSIP